MTKPTRLHLRLTGAVVLVAACRDASRPTAPADRDATRAPAPPVPAVSAAAYDTVTLRQWFAQASPAVLALPNGVYADLNEQTLRLEFGVLDEATRGSALGRLASLGIPSDAVLVEIVGPIQSEQGGRTLRDQIRPTVGGIQIQSALTATRTGNCTLGFNIQQAGRRFFVTASHCTSTRGGVENTPFFQPLRVGVPGSSVGVEDRDPANVAGGAGCPQGRVCRESDAALVRYNAATAFTLSRIARPDAVNNGSLRIDAARPLFEISAVAAVTQFTMGARANKVGRTTGWSEGPVTRTCADINLDGTNITLFCQTQVRYNTDVADSGSPVFEFAADSTATLWGIHHAGETINRVKHGWFSPFPAVAAELGFTTISQ